MMSMARGGRTVVSFSGARVSDMEINCFLRAESERVGTILVKDRYASEKVARLVG